MDPVDPDSDSDPDSDPDPNSDPDPEQCLELWILERFFMRFI